MRTIFVPCLMLFPSKKADCDNYSMSEVIKKRGTRNKVRTNQINYSRFTQTTSLCVNFSLMTRLHYTMIKCFFFLKCALGLWMKTKDKNMNGRGQAPQCSVIDRISCTNSQFKVSVVCYTSPPCRKWHLIQIVFWTAAKKN